VRVGLVCPYDLGRPGGVQDQVVRLAGWLRGDGHSVVIVAPGEHDDPGFVSAGAPTLVTANGATAPLSLSMRSVRRAVAALDDVDVVHLHEPLMPFVSLGVLRRAQRPLVGTFHADPSPAASLAYSLGRPFSRRWLRRLQVMTAVSPIAARPLEFTGRVRIIPNGVDVAEYGGDGKRSKSVVFLGRDDKRKGLSVLLEAWPLVTERDAAASLTIVGAPPPSDPIPGVEFTGRVGEDEKRRLLGSAAIFCAPNLGGESFGIVVVEAMAASCAVVASGLPAFVHVAGDTAVYVAPGDPAGLAAAIGDLVADPDRATGLGRKAHERVWRFDGAAVAAAYLDAYRQASGAD
jgi:phosphatidylinositol alpha-mannosyltransferase